MFNRFIILMTLGLVLTSCSYVRKPAFIQNRDTHYLSARSIAPLRIPPGVPSDGFENKYPVPDRAYPARQKNMSIVPPGLY